MAEQAAPGIVARQSRVVGQMLPASRVGFGKNVIVVEKVFQPLTGPAQVHRRKLQQLRVNRKHVITLHVVLEHQFPVGLDVEVDPAGPADGREVVALRSLCQWRQPLVQRCGTARDINKNTAVPGFDPGGYKVEFRIAATIEGFDDAGTGKVHAAAKSAVEPVIPGVVRTGNGPPATACTDKLCPAVTTDVVKTTQLAVFVTYQDHGCTADDERLDVAGIRNLSFGTGKHPVSLEEAGLFQGEPFGRPVGRIGQARGFFDGCKGLGIAVLSEQ